MVRLKTRFGDGMVGHARRKIGERRILDNDKVDAIDPVIYAGARIEVRVGASGTHRTVTLIS